MIGSLERFLVMPLILIGQSAGVGFLITARSILRFGSIKKSSPRTISKFRLRTVDRDFLLS